MGFPLLPVLVHSKGPPPLTREIKKPGQGSAVENDGSWTETSVESISAMESVSKHDGRKCFVYHRIHNAMCAAPERGTAGLANRTNR